MTEDVQQLTLIAEMQTSGRDLTVRGAATMALRVMPDNRSLALFVVSVCFFLPQRVDVYQPSALGQFCDWCTRESWMLLNQNHP